MNKTEEYQQNGEMVLEIKTKQGKQEEQWKQPDEDEKPHVGANGFENNGNQILVEFDNAFEKLVNWQKELQNGDYKGYDDVKVELEKKKEMNVYYDKEGVWKCRNCSWSYQIGSPWTEHIEAPKWYLHMLTNSKTVNREEPCFYCEIKGLESIFRSSATESICTSPRNTYSSVVTIKSLHSENACSNGLPVKENAGKKYFSEITVATDDVEIEDRDEKSKEFDVEKVLKEQDTHDLFCPNCNSCITKRVILRKRKRKICTSNEDAKRNKLEEVDDSLDERLPPFSDDKTQESDKEVFRCLACFSFFIPSGNGFQLFKVFGNKSNEQAHQPASPAKKRWFSSILASDEEGKGSKRDGDNIVAKLKEEDSSKPRPFVHQASVNDTDVESSVNHFQSDATYTEEDTIQGTQQDGIKIQNHLSKEYIALADSSLSGKINGISPIETTGTSYYSGASLPVIIESKAEEDTIQGTQQDGIKIQNHLSKEYIALADSSLSGKLNGISPIETTGTSYYSGASLPVIIESKENACFEKPAKAVSDNLSISIKVPVVYPGKQEMITEELKQNPAESGRGTDIIIVVEDSIEPVATQERHSLILLETRACSYVETESVDYGRFQGIEIVKSIVYGGLVELIASLGIVSSAIGADTPTLKILALGLANLIGGLFIICQNLWELKNEQHSSPTNQITINDSVPQPNQQDRYQEILGRRENFWVHATIALLSYLIYGMLPPVIYAFSFRESDNKDYKLISVGTASLVCVLMLSTGKAYIQRPPKTYLKAISYYIVIVFMTSGVSYAFGHIFIQLLDNLGWFSTGLDLGLPVHQTPTRVLPAWTSF